MAISKKQSKKSGNLRAELIEAAEKRIKEKGISALSLRTLAKDAGVSTMATYYHFANKEALIVQIAVRGFNRLVAEMAKGQSDKASPGDNIKALMRRYFNFALKNIAVYHLMFGQEIQGKPFIPEFKEASRENFYLMATLLQSSLEEDGRMVDLDAAGISFWGTLHGLVCLVSDGTILYSSRSDKKLEHLIDLAVKGLYYIE